MINENEKNAVKKDEFVEQTLFQMEKLVDEKLKNIKTFTPILLTIISSVIAFLLAIDANMDDNAEKVLFGALGLLLISFIIMIVSFFGKTNYKAIVKESRKKFAPDQFDSYCYLSDADFLKKMKKYAKRDLTEKEYIIAQFIKQKINECIFRRKRVNIALSVVAIGALILVIVCFVIAFTW